MSTRPAAAAPLNLTLRFGCRLRYEATGPAVLLLNLQVLPLRSQRLLGEQLVLGDRLPAEPFIDSHGNRVWRLILAPGAHEIRHDALVSVPAALDNHDLAPAAPVSLDALPPELFRYTLPSRYCDSDKLGNFAWQEFGRIEHGMPRVLAISEWIHRNIEYRYLSGQPDLSAWDILQRGHGVCRDFAHLAVALNRTFNLPTRYVTGHLPDVGCPDPEGHMDFHAYGEVYLGGQWFTTDARFHRPRIGRVKIACGLDAVDGAFSTIYGGANLVHFEVYAYQVADDSVRLGDPVDLSRRLDNRIEIVGS